MGQFSWIYSDTRRQVLDNREADTYLLVPKPFQEKYGRAIHETCYNGYGDFGGYDVYDLIPEWNKDMIPEIVRRMKNGTWHSSGSDSDIENLMNYYEGKPLTENYELRYLGIAMACYDEDNAALEYPIKITSMELDYDSVAPSLSDPNQGWEHQDWEMDEGDNWDDEESY